jgi:hypothetical protein
MRIGMKGERMGSLLRIGFQVSHSTLDKRHEDDNY